MKVNGIKNSSPDFKGLMNNKAVLGRLEKISEHGASFAAGVSLISALTLRPLAISMAPDTDEENKRYFSANSIASCLAKFLIVEAIALPIENAVKKIDKNPADYLKGQTIENLKTAGKTLTESKDYKFITQLMKLGTGLLTAIPKSVLTVALIPVIADKISEKKKEAPKQKIRPLIIDDPVFARLTSKNPSFKGSPTDKIAKGLSRIIDIEQVQNFAKKYSKNDTNIARNLSNLTDIVLTAGAVVQTKKSKKIQEENKKPLCYNGIISTAASILFGSAIDKLVQKGAKGTIEKFAEANKNNPKLAKYIEGINIVRPVIIFALVYYGILPIAAAFLADKIDKISKKKD